MGEEAQKTKISTTVRIYAEPKDRLQKIVWKKTFKEGRKYTEAELVSKAVDDLCEKEERKLAKV
jgi:hypothetical protein